MHSNSRKTETSLRSRIASGILSDAEKKAFGRSTRIEKLTSLLSLAALLTGFLLASDSATHTTGWVIFFTGFGMVLGVTIVGLLPGVRRMQARLERAGVMAAEQLRVLDLVAVRWAISEMARQATKTQRR